MRRKVEQATNAAIAAAASPAVAAVAQPVVHKASKWWWLALVMPFLFVGSVILAGFLALTSIIGGTANALQSNTSIDSAWCYAGDVEIPGWEADQLEVAAEIAAVWKENGFPPKALVIAYATGIVESGMRNLNYGDRDSLGWAQQRPSTGWGRPDQVMDVRLAAQAFFGVAEHTNNPGLVDIPDWEMRPVGEVAQAIQRSAFPLRYADEEIKAQALASLIIGEDVVTCQPVGIGAWVWPLPEGSYSQPFSDGQKFGMRVHPVTRVYKLHSGLDFAAPAGTPIMAASDGVVSVSGWGGAWGQQVIVDHGGGVQTRYAHASRLLVDVGDTVTAGQTIALVGTTGYSTGNHLHFEVLVDGRPVDPLVWMEQRLNNPMNTGGAFSVITYNVHYGRTEASTREVKALAARHRPDVICLQEAAGLKAVPTGYTLHQPRVVVRKGYGKAATPLLVSNRHSIASRGHIELTGPVWVGERGTGPAHATPRQIVWATLDNGVTVGCTHFTASKNISDTRRELWYTQAAGSIRFLSGGSSRLLAGDFNASPTSSWMEGFRRVATPDSNREDTHPGGRIDMVWGTRPLAPGAAVVLPKEGSDHRPVLTTWTATGSV